MSEIDLMAELDDPCPRGCGRSADECDEAEDGEDCAGSPLVQELENGMAKRFQQIQARDRTIAELGASNASLIRRVADLENQLAAVEAVVAAAKAFAYGGGEPAWRRGPTWQHVKDLVSAVDAYDAAGEGETAQDPWATNDVYTVHCPTCGRKASAYCVNAQGREVYPAHAARYQRLTEPMDVPIQDTSRAGQAGGED